MRPNRTFRKSANGRSRRRLDGQPVVFKHHGDFDARRHGGRERVGVGLFEAEFPKSPLGGEVYYPQTVAVAVGGVGDVENRDARDERAFGRHVRQVVTADDIVVKAGPRDVLADFIDDEDVQSIKENPRLQTLGFRLQRDFLRLRCK